MLRVFPANTRRWANVWSMLGRRRRRRANIDPALAQCLVFAGNTRNILWCVHTPCYMTCWPWIVWVLEQQRRWLMIVMSLGWRLLWCEDGDISSIRSVHVLPGLLITLRASRRLSQPIPPRGNVNPKHQAITGSLLGQRQWRWPSDDPVMAWRRIPLQTCSPCTTLCSQPAIEPANKSAIRMPEVRGMAWICSRQCMTAASAGLKQSSANESRFFTAIPPQTTATIAVVALLSLIINNLLLSIDNLSLRNLFLKEMAETGHGGSCKDDFFDKSSLL